MNDCERIAERLTEYADDALPPAERAEVDRHLDACPPCRAGALRECGAHDVLRARAEQLRAAPLPPGLRSRCEALAQEHTRIRAAVPWRSRIVPVTLASFLIVFGGAAMLGLATDRSDALFAAQLGADHSRCFREFVSPDAPGLDAQEVEARLAADYGWNVHVPPSDRAEGVELVHARRCLYAKGRIPHVLYRVNGQDVSLYVLDGVTRKDADVTTFGQRSRIWTRGATTFVLVTPAAAGDLAAATRYVMQHAR